MAAAALAGANGAQAQEQERATLIHGARVFEGTGKPAKIADVVKGFRVYAKKVPLDEAKPDGDYTMDHTASVFLLDAEGRFKGTIAYGENPDTAIKKLENLMKG